MYIVYELLFPAITFLRMSQKIRKMTKSNILTTQMDLTTKFYIESDHCQNLSIFVYKFQNISKLTKNRYCF